MRPQSSSFGAEPQQPIRAHAQASAHGSPNAKATVLKGEKAWQSWALADGQKVRLVYSGPDLTQPVMRKLIKYLEMAQEDLPETLEPTEAPEAPDSES